MSCRSSLSLALLNLAELLGLDWTRSSPEGRFPSRPAKVIAAVIPHIIPTYRLHHAKFYTNLTNHNPDVGSDRRMAHSGFDLIADLSREEALYEKGTT